MTESDANPYAAPALKEDVDVKVLKEDFKVRFNGQLDKRAAKRIHEKVNPKFLIGLSAVSVLIAALVPVAFSSHDGSLAAFLVLVGFFSMICWVGLVCDYFGAHGAYLWNSQTHLKAPFSGELSHDSGEIHIGNATIRFIPSLFIESVNDHGISFKVSQSEALILGNVAIVLPKFCFKHSEWEFVRSYFQRMLRHKKQKKGSTERAFCFPSVEPDAIEISTLSNRKLKSLFAAEPFAHWAILFFSLAVLISSAGYLLYCFCEYHFDMNSVPHFRGVGTLWEYNSMIERSSIFNAAIVVAIVSGLFSCHACYCGWLVRKLRPSTKDSLFPGLFWISPRSFTMQGHASWIKFDWSDPTPKQWFWISPAGIRIVTGFNWTGLIPRGGFASDDEFRQVVNVVRRTLPEKRWLRKPRKYPG